MDSQFHGLIWSVFVNGLKAGEVGRPFLVLEDDPDGKPSWFLYAESGRHLVQVHTMRGQPRSWRKLDGALGDLARAIAPLTLPGIMVYASPDAVVLPLSGAVEQQQRA